MNIQVAQTRTHKQNPRTLTLRFRAWAHCQIHGADMTRSDLAEALDVEERALRLALRGQSWANALRTTALDYYEPEEYRGAAAFEGDLIAKTFVGGMQ